MKTYSVTLPITGIIFIEVQAASEGEAIDNAMDEATLDLLEEWQTHKAIVRGNVFYGTRNEAEAELIDDDEDGK